MSEIIGLLGALTAAICWGSQFVTFKIAKKKPSVAQYQLMTVIGIFILSLAAVPVFNLSFNLNMQGIIGGLIWSCGNFAATKAVEKAGLAKTMPLWSATIILLSFVIGLFVFNEIIKVLALGIVGAISIIAGIFLVSKSYESTAQKSARLGIMFAVIAGILFGIQFIPLKIASLTAKEYFFPMSVGILSMGALIFLLHREKISNISIHGISGGIIWNIGNLGGIFSVSLLGLAVGFSLTQLAAVVSVLWGVLAFKEVKESRKRLFVFAGAIIVILGTIALTFSKI